MKEVTKAICRNDANLATADAAVEVLLEELKKNGNIFALQLREKVINRIIERRQSVLVALMKFLLNPESAMKVDAISGTKI